MCLRSRGHKSTGGSCQRLIIHLQWSLWLCSVVPSGVCTHVCWRHIFHSFQFLVTNCIQDFPILSKTYQIQSYFLSFSYKRWPWILCKTWIRCALTSLKYIWGRRGEKEGRSGSSEKGVLEQRGLDDFLLCPPPCRATPRGNKESEL